MELKEIKLLADRIKANISKVIIGKDDVIDLVTLTLICSGHILIEDVPGVGKTMLAKCLARSVDCEFKRIQFTPDLLPSDLTGINYFDQKSNEFIFRPGPLFANVVLADEINRATPRTQSSLLECMEERQVTVDGNTRTLGQPFFVIATQNPIETRGTFPLPEAQLDRFLLRVRLGYPTYDEGMDLLSRFQASDPFSALDCVASAEEIIDARNSFQKVIVNEALKGYIMKIIEATRKNDGISLGVSPRGSLALMKASQVRALFEGREYITPDDVKRMAAPVLAHRILLKGHAISGGTANAEAAIADILKKVTVPVEDI
jgi:MoxR-like ATPase